MAVEMRRIPEGFHIDILNEFCERSASHYPHDTLLMDSFLIAHLSGRSTRSEQIIDQDGVVHDSIRAAARANGVSDMFVRRMLSGSVRTRRGERYQSGKGYSFRYAP